MKALGVRSGAQDAAAEAMARAAEAVQQAAPKTATQLRSASDSASSAPAFQLTFTAHRGTGLAARPATAAAAAAEVCMPTPLNPGQLGWYCEAASETASETAPEAAPSAPAFQPVY